MPSRRRLLSGLLALLPMASVRGVSAQVLQTAVGSPFSMFANKDFSAWLQQGNANWQIVDGQAVITQGGGWLIGRVRLTDFDLNMEFWSGPDTQASLYIRCIDNTYVSDRTAYRINLGTGFIQDYGPGSIVHLLHAPRLATTERWNNLKVSARGPYLSMWHNGQQVAEKFYNTQFPNGTIALYVTNGAFLIKKLDITIPGRW